MADTSALSPTSPSSVDEGESSSSSMASSVDQTTPTEVAQTQLESPELRHRPSLMSYRVPRYNRESSYAVVGNDNLGDDTLSCVIVIVTFWFFVSMTLIMGIFGSESLQVSPYCSLLLRPNPIFVRSLKVEISKQSKAFPVLYGLYETPPLDKTKLWFESVNASVKPESHQEWAYYLNKGSQVNISYNVPSSSSMLLVVAKGIEELAQWLQDPSYPDSTVSWTLIRGSGSVSQDISKSYNYYVAVGNLNSDYVEVELNLSIRSAVHEIADSYYKCSLSSSGVCNLKIPFPGGTSALLTTPESLEGTGGERLKVELSYKPRWMTYIFGIGGMTSIMLWVFNFLNKIRRNMEDAAENESGDLGSERAPLLNQKDDDLHSLGSSYDSASQNEDETQEDLEEGCRRLCVICFDAPKDCFFIPCGHCATCFSCGIRVAENDGNCPICRRKMKKVRKIYTV